MTSKTLLPYISQEVSRCHQGLIIAPRNNSFDDRYKKSLTSASFLPAMLYVNAIKAQLCKTITFYFSLTQRKITEE